MGNFILNKNKSFNIMPSIPINTVTCKKGGFWSTEILSAKVTAKPQCCGLFTKDPAELPVFCPPTPAWCKYEEAGNKWPASAKKTCCEDFGAELTSCKSTTPSSTGPAPATTPTNKAPTKSVSQALGQNVPRYNYNSEYNVFAQSLHVTFSNSKLFVNEEHNHYNGPVTMDFPVMLV